MPDRDESHDPVKIYKDVLGYNKDELFSDAFPIEELPALYAVTAKMGHQ